MLGDVLKIIMSAIGEKQQRLFPYPFKSIHDIDQQLKHKSMIYCHGTMCISTKAADIQRAKLSYYNN